MSNLSKIGVGLGVLAVVLSIPACGGRDGAGSSPSRGDGDRGKLTVAVVNYPLAYFAARIGEDHVDVVFPAPADEDPAWWTPDADALESYQKADVILLNGATYAKWVPKVTLPPSRMVDTSKRAASRYISLEDSTTHAHGPEGEHEHTGTAFTTWLDPEIALAQARAVKEALEARDPAHAADYEAGLASLEQDLRAIRDGLAAAVAKHRDRPVVGSHPVYQYLTRAYGLAMRDVHWEPDEAPDDAAWTSFGAMLEDHPAKWMLWEGPPIEASVARLKELGVQSVVFAPCGNVPDEGDYLSVMRKNVESLERAYR